MYWNENADPGSGDVVPGVARAVEDDPAGAAVEVVEGRRHVEALGDGDRRDHPGEVGVGREVGPDGDRALAKAQPAVGDEHRRVGAVLHAQALADRAPAQRAVEREVVRLQLLEAAAARVADPVLAVPVDRPARLSVLVADPRDVHDPLAQVERRLDRVGQPRPRRPPDDGAVDHDLDPVLAAVGQLGRLVQVNRLAIDPHPGEARGPQVVPERLVGLVVAALDRRHHVDLRPLGQVQHLLDDLVGRLRADRDVALRAVRLPQPGEEDAQVIVDLGDGADRRPRALAGRLLLDADRRREARDPLHLRLLERCQELPGVAREALDVPPLALGVQRVDRQRALAGAARARCRRSSGRGGCPGRSP